MGRKVQLQKEGIFHLDEVSLRSLSFILATSTSTPCPPCPTSRDYGYCKKPTIAIRPRAKASLFPTASRFAALWEFCIWKGALSVLSGLFGFVCDAGAVVGVLGSLGVVVVSCARTVVENVDCELLVLVLVLVAEDVMVSVEMTVLPAELVVVTVNIPPTIGMTVDSEVTVLPAEFVVVTVWTDATVVVTTELVRTVLVDGAMVVVMIDPRPYVVEPSSMVAGYASVTVLPPARVVVA